MIINIIKILSILFFSVIITVGAQNVFPPSNSDFKWHDINNVKLLVGNLGSSNPIWLNVSGYSYVLNYPKGSNNDILAYNGIWVGAIVGRDTLASVSGNYDNNGPPGGHIHEFYPDFNKADTVNRVSIFEKQNPDIDPNQVNTFFNENGTLHDDYYPLSHDDLICQYYDDKITKNTAEAPDILKLHTPLHAHIIERSFAWDNQWYDDMIFYDYFVINESEKTWNDVYIGIYSDNNSGNFALRVTNNDDLCYWDEVGQFMLQTDKEGSGGDDFDQSAYIGWDILGMKYNNKESLDLDAMNFTFWSWEGGPKDPHFNVDYYKRLSNGTIDRTYGPNVTGTMKGLIAYGPVEELLPGDTLRTTVALVGGRTVEDLRENVNTARSLNQSGFQVPKSPNPPKFTLEPMANGIIIDWTWKDEYTGYNPIESVDNSRIDGIEKDFDGFKIYRSTESEYGPWKLIAQFDSLNGYGYDTGLKFDHIDEGLKNGLNYWYTVTSIDIRDDSSQIGPLESPKSFMVKSTIPGPKPEDNDDDEVYVVPNPYRVDQDYSRMPAWELPTQEMRNDWYEIDRRIVFMNLPAKCNIKIFTINGLLVNDLEHDREQKGYNIANWNLLNKNNHAVGSGVYYFVIQGRGNDRSFNQVGKFVIVK